MLRAMRRWCLLVILLSGCPAATEAPISANCTKVGEKCRTPSGPLGVCDTGRCQPGEREPCLKCVPQH